VPYKNQESLYDPNVLVRFQRNASTSSIINTTPVYFQRDNGSQGLAIPQSAYYVTIANGSANTIQPSLRFTINV